MAVVAVTFDAQRIEDAETTTGWGNIGGGGGIATEPDIVWQGTFAASRKVGTSRIGRDFLDGSTWDFTAARRRHWIAKVAATNYAALLTRTSPAMGLRIGNSASVYYEYEVLGSDNYPVTGGWVIFAVSPNVSGYRDGTSGSPTLTTIDYFGVLSDFSATSKAENLVIDAIDYGVGMCLVGGDGVSTDGVFQDFVDADEGSSSTGRYGFVTTRSGVLYVLGRLAIGEDETQTTTATGFTDSGKTVVWQNSYCETGFNELLIELGNASTVVDISSCVFTSVGMADNDLGFPASYTTTEDTRALVTVTGTSGTMDWDTVQVQNFESITLTSACTLVGCDIEIESLTQASADISEGVIRTTSAANVATLGDPTFGSTSDLHDTEFVQAGSGHALEIDTATSYDLTNITFTGYNGSNAQPDSAIFINVASGTVTLNILGGDSPTYRLPGGSTATVDIVVNPVTLTVTVQDITDASLLQNARVYVEADTGGPLSAGTEIINDLTNGSGIASDTRTYASDQPITGWVRRATPGFGTLYKQAAIAGTIDSSSGLGLTIQMIPDE